MEQKYQFKKQVWHLKLIPLLFFWLLFLAINATINQAPYAKGDLQIEHIVLFFIPLFIACYFSFALLLQSKRRGILVGLLLVSLLLFRLYQLTTPLTTLFLFVSLGAIEWYFGKGKRVKPRITP